MNPTKYDINLFVKENKIPIYTHLKLNAILQLKPFTTKTKSHPIWANCRFQVKIKPS